MKKAEIIIFFLITSFSLILSYTYLDDTITLVPLAGLAATTFLVLTEKTKKKVKGKIEKINVIIEKRRNRKGSGIT